MIILYNIKIYLWNNKYIIRIFHCRQFSILNKLILLILISSLISYATLIIKYFNNKDYQFQKQIYINLTYRMSEEV